MSGDAFSHAVDNNESEEKFVPIQYINFKLKPKHVCSYEGECKINCVTTHKEDDINFCIFCIHCEKIDIPRLLDNNSV